MSEDTIPVILIPPHRNILRVFPKVQQIFVDVELVHGTHVVAGYRVQVDRDKIDDVSKFSGDVDLAVVYAKEPIELDGFSVIRDMDLGLQIYSNKHEEHRGIMTGPPVSDARYPWMIKRNNNSALLVQHLDGDTSQHFHEQTTEYLLPLAGSTTLHHRKETGLESGTLPEKAFTLILPGMVHRLSSQGPAINLLCMSPYDPELEDHHYVGLEAIAKSSEIRSP